MDDGECAEATKVKIMHINKCCKNIEQEHQLTYKKHEEGKRTILSGRKRGSIRNKGVKIQQKK
jgi:hypothetical protein